MIEEGIPLGIGIACKLISGVIGVAGHIAFWVSGLHDIPIGIILGIGDTAIGIGNGECPAQFIVGVGGGIAHSIGGGGQISVDIVDVAGNASHGVGRREQVAAAS